MQLYAYAIVTSTYAEASVAYGNTKSEIGIKNTERPSTCKFVLYSPLEITGASGIGGGGGARGADFAATAKKHPSCLNSGQEIGFLLPCFLVWLRDEALKIGIHQQGVYIF